MNKRDLEELHKEIEREAISSTRMLGSVAILGIAILVTIFLFASCTAPIPDAYEQHQADLKVYDSITNYNGISHSTLNKMWDTFYIEALINTEVK